MGVKNTRFLKTTWGDKMKKISVSIQFVEAAREMASDLYGLAEVHKDKMIMKEMKKRIKKADKYLEQVEN